MRGKKILFLLFEYPSANTAGYHSYNRDALLTAIKAGAEVSLEVISSRYKVISDDISEFQVLGGLNIRSPGLFRMGRYAFVLGFGELLRFFLSRLKSRFLPSTSQSKRRHIGRFLTGKEIRDIRRRVEKVGPDLVVLDTLFMSPLATELPCPSLILAHDIFHQRCESLTQSGLDPYPKIDETTEQQFLRSTDLVVAISEDDATVLKRFLPERSVAIMAPALKWNPCTFSTESGAANLFYMGSSAHHNVHAIRTFLRDVWPCLKRKMPDIRLLIAGDVCLQISSPPADVLLLGRLNKPELTAKNCVAGIDPVLGGSGVKIKVLSYLSMGLPCITTAAGAQGLGRFADLLYKAETPADFIEAVQMLSGPLFDRASYEVSVQRAISVHNSDGQADFIRKVEALLQ